jgi:acetyl-CoA carboxylase carboxyl transferase subunit alpha
MLSHSWYSVISPEGCAAILWKVSDEKTNTQAADALALTARENLANGLIDATIEEPVGGAHRNPKVAAERVQNWIVEQLRELTRFKPETLIRRRYERLRRIGAVADTATPA